MGFEEGAAMQADWRERYARIAIENTALDPGALRYSWQFFRGDDAQLTRHYAQAKREVRRRLDKVGPQGVFYCWSG